MRKPHPDVAFVDGRSPLEGRKGNIEHALASPKVVLHYNAGEEALARRIPSFHLHSGAKPHG